MQAPDGQVFLWLGGFGNNFPRLCLLCVLSSIFCFPFSFPASRSKSSAVESFWYNPLPAGQLQNIIGMCCCLPTSGTGSIVTLRVHLQYYRVASKLCSGNQLCFQHCQMAGKCNKILRSWFFSCCRSDKIISFVELHGLSISSPVPGWVLKGLAEFQSLEGVCKHTVASQTWSFFPKDVKVLCAEGVAISVL